MKLNWTKITRIYAAIPKSARGQVPKMRIYQTKTKITIQELIIRQITPRQDFQIILEHLQGNNNQNMISKMTFNCHQREV